jgi:transcriptional regulator with XRE-family HTH domain
MTLGENIKTLRARDGISQGKLAELTGISKGYLSQLESGQIPSPSANYVRSIASAFNVSMELLLATEIPPGPVRKKYTFLLTAAEADAVDGFIAAIRQKDKQ